MADSSGLNKDGGIDFTRKPKSKEPKMFSRRPEDKVEEVVEEPKEERNLDANELAKMERLGAKLSQPKRIQGGGFSINGTEIIVVLIYIDSLLIDPNTLDTLNSIDDMFGLNVDFEQIIATIQGYKAQIIGMCVTTQTMIMQYKSTVQKMKDDGNESFYEVFNKQLEEAGI